MSILNLIINLVEWVLNLPVIIGQFVVDAIDEFKADKKGFKMVALTACVGIIIMFLAMGISAWKADHMIKPVPDTEAEPVITDDEVSTTVTLESSVVKLVKNSDIKKLFDIK